MNNKCASFHDSQYGANSSALLWKAAVKIYFKTSEIFRYHGMNTLKKKSKYIATLMPAR